MSSSRRGLRVPAALAGAFAVASHAHSGQLRREGDLRPYLVHPLAVAGYLADDGADDDLLRAALLHDVAERSDWTIAELRRCFGPRVARLVDDLTEPSALRPTADAERRRHARIVRHLERLEPDAVALKAADVCSNLADLSWDHAARGAEVWSAYTSPADEQVAFYRAVAAVALARLDGRPRLRGRLTRTIALADALATCTDEAIPLEVRRRRRRHRSMA